MRATAIAAGPAGGPSTVASAAEVVAPGAVGLEEIVSVDALPVLLAFAAGASSIGLELETFEESCSAGALKTGVAPCRVGSGSGFGFAFGAVGSGAGTVATTCAAGAASSSPEETSE